MHGWMDSVTMKHKDGTISPGAIVSPLIKPGPSEISFKNMKFLIMDRPTELSLPTFTEELKKRHVKDVVRVCEANYKTESLANEGIQVWDMQFDDGTAPTVTILDEWFDLLRKRFQENPDTCIAVHCVAGLGRAPVLVAVALIELGMRYEDAVELIRQKRRGAINAKQLSYLASYRPKGRLRVRNPNKCTIQ